MNFSKKKILVALGTRPEAIKLAPVIHELNRSDLLQPVVVATAQHRQLLDQVLHFFDIKPDYDLNLMKPNQDLFYTTAECLNRIKALLETLSPSLVIIQGDTTTAFTVALSAFYLKIPIAHVEAGLRTQNKYSPFPEEMNRRLISPLADLHFAPTEPSKENLIRENIDPSFIEVTGNTSIDALHLGATKNCQPPRELKGQSSDRLILLTLHRRENFGQPLIHILTAVRRFAVDYPDYQIVYPVHPNPNVREQALLFFSSLKNVHLLDPVDYSEMLYLIQNSQFILTDSGGIQEEAPTLGKPVLILRDNTERPEAVESGCAMLVGNDPDLIYQLMISLTQTQSQLYQSMATASNPFGDGTASVKVRNRIETHLFKHHEEKSLCVE